MTNEQLIKNWKSLDIKFNSQKEIMPMFSMFLVCVGETKIDVGGNREIVVGFYQGYDEKNGSPAVFFTSDKNNKCYTYAMDSKNKTHIKSCIGNFIEN